MGARRTALVITAVAAAVFSLLVAWVGLPTGTREGGALGLEPVLAAFIPAFAGALVVFGAETRRWWPAWTGTAVILLYGVLSLVAVGLVYLAYGGLMAALLWGEARTAGRLRAAPRPHARA